MCHDHLTEISRALQAYRRDHQGQLPKDLMVPAGQTTITPEETLYPRYIKSKSAFSCPKQVNYFLEHGSNVKTDFRTYQYLIQPWVQDPTEGAYFTKKELYQTIVPERGNTIVLVSCLSHPSPGKMLAIMWDGSLKEEEMLYDPTLGRGHRDPQRQEVLRMMRKRGARIPEE